MTTLPISLPRTALAGLPLIAAALLARARQRGVLDYRIDLQTLTLDASAIAAELTERNDGT